MDNKLPPRIPLGNLNEDLWREILVAYQTVTGESINPQMCLPSQLQAVLLTLKEHDSCAYRLGSSISTHSKLVFFRIASKEVTIDFDPNTADDESKQARAMQQNFRKEIETAIKLTGIKKAPS